MNGTPRVNPLADLKAGKLPKQPPRETVVAQCVTWAATAERHRLAGETQAHEKIVEVLEAAHAGYQKLYGEQAAQDLATEMDRGRRQVSPGILPRRRGRAAALLLLVLAAALLALLLFHGRARGDAKKCPAGTSAVYRTDGTIRSCNLPACPAGQSRKADGTCGCPDGQLYNEKTKSCYTPE